jgi:hypothetical protein
MSNKGNNTVNEQPAHRVGESFSKLIFNMGFMSKTFKEFI